MIIQVFLNQAAIDEFAEEFCEFDVFGTVVVDVNKPRPNTVDCIARAIIPELKKIKR